MNKIATIAFAALALSGAAFAADAKAGAAAFDKSCKGCHGATGAGNPAIAKMLNATIPDLGSAAVQGKSDADLAKVITDGEGKMKPVKTLSGPPADVVAFLRTLKK
jgi:mono/diheme cytochrome c family protein